MRKARLGVMMLIASMSLTACGGYSSSGSNNSLYVESGVSLAENYNSAVFDTGKSTSTINVQADLAMDTTMRTATAGSGYNNSSKSSSSSSSSSSTLTSVTSEEVEIAKETKKVIRTVDMTIKIPSSDTLNQTVQGLIGLAEQYGGWSAMNKTDFESSYANGQLVLKVPQDSVDDFLNSVRENGLRITTINDNSKDVTMQYSDTETQLRIKQVEKEKYMRYLEEARDIEEILAIEDRLDDVINEIESYTSKLKTMDSQITYTSIGIKVTCETSINTESTGEIIKARLSSIGEDAVYLMLDGIDFLVEALVGLLFTLPIGLGVIYIGIKVIKRAIFGKRKNDKELDKFERKMKRSRRKVKEKDKVEEQLIPNNYNSNTKENDIKNEKEVISENKISDESK